MELKSRHELSERQKGEVEITSCIHDLFMSDYGLTSSSFKEECHQETTLEKVYVKRMPNLIIENHIKYI